MFEKRKVNQNLTNGIQSRKGVRSSLKKRKGDAHNSWDDMSSSEEDQNLD